MAKNVRFLSGVVLLGSYYSFFCQEEKRERKHNFVKGRLKILVIGIENFG